MRSFSIYRLILGLVLTAFASAHSHAGDVKVQSHGSTLSILGSPKGDNFSVSSNGVVVVVHSASLGTTINGKTEVSIRNGINMDIRIDLGAGDDICEIHDLSCLSLSVMDGSKDEKNADTIRLNDVDANGLINVLCFAGDDLVTLNTVEAGLSVSVATGEGNDIAALYGIATEDLWVSMGDGDDMVLAGEFDCSNVKILGGSDTWTRADTFNRLAGDVVIHIDIFEISEFDILGSSGEFENELSLLDDVMDTPLEDALNEIEANLNLGL